MIMLPWYTVYIIVGLEWRNACMDFYAFGRIIYANLESLSLFYKTTGNQEHWVQESRMSRIRKEKI